MKNEHKWKKVKDVEADPLFNAFLKVQKTRTRNTYRCWFRKLYEFDPSITGQQMLNEKTQWEETKIDELQKYLENQGYSPNYVSGACGAVRGFFSLNRQRLELTRP